MNFVPAMARAREAQEKGIEHSKIPKLIEALILARRCLSAS